MRTFEFVSAKFRILEMQARERNLVSEPMAYGDRGGTVVKVLCYKSEVIWFDSRWYHWNFLLT